MKSYFNLRDSYKTYKQEVEVPIDIRTYMYIVNGFIQFLVCKLFSRGEILLPERLGVLSIIGRKQKVRIEDGKIKGLAPDWGKTKELWAHDEQAKENKQLVYHFNEQTNGVRYKFFWGKVRVAVPNKTLYSLKMTRANKRFLSELIKSGKEYLIKS